jgi:uracil-DNA glycosylase
MLMTTPEKTGQLDPTWQAVLGAEFEQPYMHSLKAFFAAGKSGW